MINKNNIVEVGLSQQALPDKNIIDISFQDISYTISLNKEQQKNFPHYNGKRAVLKNVSGIFKHGQVSAILGASGAGKTSLLNILCCRIENTSTTEVTGKFLANNSTYDQSTFSNFGSYVMQDDRLIESLTVREVLQFAANLRFNGTQQEKDLLVKQIIKQLQLDRCIDTLIGGFFLKGVSGGERKRTSIGFELVTNPNVLFLDEPTSGLDSFTAYKVIQLLKNQAERNNKTIIFTIHQPNSDIWNLFDKVLLLVEGQFIYQGPGQQEIIDYFSNIGFPCPVLNNPADYFLSIMVKNEKNVSNYKTFFTTYRERQAMLVEKQIDEREQSQYVKSKSVNSYCYEIVQITKRAFKQVKRNPYMGRIRFIQSIVLALLAGALFWKLPNGQENPHDQRSLWDRFGFLFFSIIIVFQTTIGPVILTFPLERGVFLKEENSKLYHTVSYFIGKSLTDIPYLFMVPFFYTLITYWMTGLNDDNPQTVFRFFFILLLLSFIGNSIGLLAGCAFPEQKSTPGVMPMILLPFILFSGFFSNRVHFPQWIGWLEYISPLKYTFEALVRNEFEQHSYYEPNPVEQLGLQFGLWESIGLQFCLFFFFRILALIFLLSLKKKVQ